MNFEDPWLSLQTIWIQMKPHKTWGFIWDPNCLTFRLYMSKDILWKQWIFANYGWKIIWKNLPSMHAEFLTFLIFQFKLWDTQSKICICNHRIRKCNGHYRKVTIKVESNAENFSYGRFSLWTRRRRLVFSKRSICMGSFTLMIHKSLCTFNFDHPFDKGIFWMGKE